MKQNPRDCEKPPRVLIETYWNVNASQAVFFSVGELVLIETYWNVNSFFQVHFLPRCRRLNRNILECKLNTSVITNYSISVLIETYWNVNIREIYVDIPNDVGLNRNILECKCVNVICRMC